MLGDDNTGRIDKLTNIQMSCAMTKWDLMNLRDVQYKASNQVIMDP